MNNSVNIPKLAFYHLNGKGTGSVAQFELHPAHGLDDGAIYLRVTPQLANNGKIALSMDNAMSVRLGFTDICKMLQVFRGECESIVGGIRIPCGKHDIFLDLRHQLYPASYDLTLNEIPSNNASSCRDLRFTFSNAEALGLAIVFENSLKEIAFGTSFEATSIAIARDQEAAKIASEEAAQEAESSCKKAVAKVSAVGMLCAYYGKEYADRIEKAVDIACGDYTEDETARITDEERQLGMDALGSNHPIWKYVK